MNSCFKNFLNLSRQSRQLSLLQPSLFFRPAYLISTKNQRILKEVNKENRELYTKEQKRRILDEEYSRNTRSIFGEEETQQPDRVFNEDSSNYFGREMDNYFKTLNGSKDMKKEQEIDLTGYEVDEDVIKDIQRQHDDFQFNFQDNSLNNNNSNLNQINKSEISDLSEEEDEIIQTNIEGIRNKRKY